MTEPRKWSRWTEPESLILVQHRPNITAIYRALRRSGFTTRTREAIRTQLKERT